MHKTELLTAKKHPAVETSPAATHAFPTHGATRRAAQPWRILLPTDPPWLSMTYHTEIALGHRWIGGYQMTAMAPTPAAWQSAPATVVLADCDEYTRQSVHDSLPPFGHRVLDLTDPVEVAAAARKSDTDVILIDIEQWSDAAWSLLDSLAKAEGGIRARVVLITPENDDEAVLAGMRIGAHDQVSKPFRSAALLARVEAAAKTKHLADQLVAEHERSVRLSGLDMISGVSSHDRIEDDLKHATAAASRYGHDVAVVIADIDHFTRLNDVHGARAGDCVLREVAGHIAADLRTSDMLGRWGNDEFMMVLPHTPVQGAAVLANRLRMTLGEIAVRLFDGTPVSAASSFGCASGQNADGLIESANDVLRQAKRAGGNSVRCA